MVKGFPLARFQGPTFCPRVEGFGKQPEKPPQEDGLGGVCRLGGVECEPPHRAGARVREKWIPPGAEGPCCQIWTERVGCLQGE